MSIISTLVNGEDDYTRSLETDERVALWRAELSNGAVIVQDDGRPGYSPCSAWMRLKLALQSEALRITNLWLQFRSHHQRNILPSNATGYFFSKCLVGHLTEQRTDSYYLLGHVEGTKVLIQKWAVPELVLVDTFVRPIENVNEHQLILRFTELYQ